MVKRLRKDCFSLFELNSFGRKSELTVIGCFRRERLETTVLRGVMS